MELRRVVFIRFHSLRLPHARDHTRVPLYPSGSIQELTGQAQMTYVQRANWRTSRGVVLLINPYPFALCIMPFDQLVRPPVV
jgi:hypothetical protein